MKVVKEKVSEEMNKPRVKGILPELKLGVGLLAQPYQHDLTNGGLWGIVVSSQYHFHSI
jgi:hypothetical protein